MKTGLRAQEIKWTAAKAKIGRMKFWSQQLKLAFELKHFKKNPTKLLEENTFLKDSMSRLVVPTLTSGCMGRNSESSKLVFTVFFKMEQCNESFHLESKTSLLCICISKISTVCSTCLHIAVSVLPLMALRVGQMYCVVCQQTDGLFVALAGTLQWMGTSLETGMALS